MKLAILGGSFNPVHLGHVALANQAVNEFGYTKVIFVPACNPPHKTLAKGATDEDRCNMLALAIEDNPLLGFETCEIERKGTSYTIDTVKYLYKKYNGSIDNKIGLIIGADLVKGFHLWKDVQELTEMTDVLLASRSCTVEYSDFSYTYTKMKNALLDISSQEIRRKIKHGENWKEHVDEGVYEYIQAKKLYTANNS